MSKENGFNYVSEKTELQDEYKDKNRIDSNDGGGSKAGRSVI